MLLLVGRALVGLPVIVLLITLVTFGSVGAFSSYISLKLLLCGTYSVGGAACSPVTAANLNRRPHR